MTPAETQALVLDNRGIVYAVLQRLRVHHGGWAEAEAEGMLALCEAAASFDSSRAVFSTWAWARVRWRILDWMNGHRREALSVASLELAAELEGEPTETSVVDKLHRLRAGRRLQALISDDRFSETELADYLGVTRRTVRSHREAING